MARFFLDAPLTPGAILTLPDAIAHHAVRTWRLETGTAITLFNGQGGEYPARLTVGPGRNPVVQAELTGFDPREAELPFAITVAQGLSGGDKMDWTVEKAVELGAAAIQPLACARSVVRLNTERATRRVAHWRALCEAACAQCTRNRVPVVHAPQPVQDWLHALPAGGMRLLLSPRGAIAPATLSAPPPGMPVWLMVGPEGGFTTEEEDAARHAGFIALTLGPRVLRTETAAAAALAMLTALWTR